MTTRRTSPPGPEALRLALDGHAGEPGVRPLRQILDRLTFRLSDSDLEIYFRPVAASAGLPSPLSKHRVNGFEVDFFSRHRRFVPFCKTQNPGRSEVGDVRLGADVAKQLKDAGSPNSSAIWATEDAEMRRATYVPRRATHAEARP